VAHTPITLKECGVMLARASMTQYTKHFYAGYYFGKIYILKCLPSSHLNPLVEFFNFAAQVANRLILVTETTLF